MICHEVRALLQPFADGELAQPERRALLDHAAACPDCARLLAARQRLVAALGAALSAEAEAPAGMAARILSRIRSQPRRALPIARIWEVSMSRRIAIALAAAGLVVAAVALLRPADSRVHPERLLASAAYALEEAQSLYCVAYGTEEFGHQPLRMSVNRSETWVGPGALYSRTLDPQRWLVFAHRVDLAAGRLLCYHQGRWYRADISGQAADAREYLRRMRDQVAPAQFFAVLEHLLPGCRTQVSEINRGDHTIALVEVSGPDPAHDGQQMRWDFEIDERADRLLAARCYAGDEERMVGRIERIDYNTPAPKALAEVGPGPGERAMAATARFEIKADRLEFTLLAGGEEMLTSTVWFEHPGP